MTELRILVEQAKSGDDAAFRRLVEFHQAGAIGCAAALLGDYHLAQDVAQEAFAAAYRALPTLDAPEAFPAWLRSIVRHTCYRLLRRRQPGFLPLDAAADVPTGQAGPEGLAEEDERRREVLAALGILPPEQRELVLLHYWREYSHREIAALLGIPVTKVNNRLHLARMRLREEMHAMAETTSHEADSQAPAAVGEVVAVHGPLVEVKFAHHRLPPLRSWLVASAGGRKTILAVVGFLTDGDARAVAVADGAGLKIGQEIAAAGEGIAIPIDDRNAREAVAQIARLTHTTPGSGRRVETGIKALDLFCPLVDSDVVGFAAPPGVGQIVLIQELLYRLATRPERLTLIATVPTVEEPSCEDPYSIGGIQTVYLPRRDMAARPAGFLDPIDVVIALSLDLARLGMYPAIDPLASRSMHLDADTVGSTQIEVATRTRELLRRYPPEQEAAKPGERPADERRDAARARRLRRFLTQPFYVAAPWIRWSAAFVPLADTIRGCQGILDGAYDDLPEEAFYMANSIEEVVSRAGG